MAELDQIADGIEQELRSRLVSEIGSHVVGEMVIENRHGAQYGLSDFAPRGYDRSHQQAENRIRKQADKVLANAHKGGTGAIRKVCYAPVCCRFGGTDLSNRLHPA